jgi:hypothetical protein
MRTPKRGLRPRADQHTLPRQWETDQFSGQPATMWPLNSKGILEQELIGALQTRFKHAA